MPWLQLFKTVGKAVIDFVFPRQCSYCGTVLTSQEEVWCTRCRLSIKYTNYFRMPLNPVYYMFSMFKDVIFGGALWFYDRRSLVANLIHELKFLRRKELAEPIGKELGEELAESPYVPKDIDTIIPVPLHPKRLKWRGFNQAEEVARHLALVLNTTVNTQVLKRIQETEAQSGKSLHDRWINISGAFALTDPESIRGKKIILLDDVLTTGTTLSHCLRVIEQANPESVCVVTVAFANKARF